MGDIADQVRIILIEEWDPIGIADEVAAQDEYDAYALPVVRLISAGATVEALAAHLVDIETARMGLAGDEARARRVAARLVSLGR